MLNYHSLPDLTGYKARAAKQIRTAFRLASLATLLHKKGG